MLLWQNPVERTKSTDCSRKKLGRLSQRIAASGIVKGAGDIEQVKKAPNWFLRHCRIHFRQHGISGWRCGSRLQSWPRSRSQRDEESNASNCSEGDKQRLVRRGHVAL